jgi:uncharacterized protein
MHIQLETPNNNTIRSYTDREITVGTTVYSNSVIISNHVIISSWPIDSVQALNETTLEPLLLLDPEIIIIGHQQLGTYTPMPVIHYLSKQRIGIECMSIGAACRTFNVLLGEGRKVIAGIIFSSP